MERCKCGHEQLEHSRASIDGFVIPGCRDLCSCPGFTPDTAEVIKLPVQVDVEGVVLSDAEGNTIGDLAYHFDGLVSRRAEHIAKAINEYPSLTARLDKAVEALGRYTNTCERCPWSKEAHDGTRLDHAFQNAAAEALKEIKP